MVDWRDIPYRHSFGYVVCSPEWVESVGSTHADTMQHTQACLFEATRYYVGFSKLRIDKMYQTAMMKSMAASRARAIKKLNGGHNGKRRGLVRGQHDTATTPNEEPITESSNQEVRETLVAG